MRIFAGLMVLYCLGSLLYAYRFEKIAMGRSLKGILFVKKNDDPAQYRLAIGFHIFMLIGSGVIMLLGHF